DVTVSLPPDAQLAVPAPASPLTFTPLNWNTAQTVTVKAVDDPVVEASPHTGAVAMAIASSDPGYGVLTVPPKSANITDNDVAGFTINELGGVAVTEGATTDSYTVVLDASPAAGKTVTVTVNNDGQAYASPSTTPSSTYVFDSTNWNVPKPVTVVAADDAIAEVDPLTSVLANIVTSDDSLWGAVAAKNVNATVHDDDVAGVAITPASGLSVSETGPTSATYAVKLTSQPTGTVTIALGADADSTVSPTSLSFDATTWNSAATVTVTAVDDSVFEGSHTTTITHTPTSSDTMYSSLTIAPQVVAVNDNDVPGVDVTPASGVTATEGAAHGTYAVKLKSEPTSAVTIAFATGSQIDPITSLVFTTSNWMTAQNVDVVATNDAIAEGSHTGTIAHTITGDAAYAALTMADQSIAISDNDTAAVNVNVGSGVDVDEAGATSDTFDITLNSQPTAPVTIAVTPDAQVTTDKTSLTFTAANWNTAQIVQVTAVDDPVDEAATHDGHVSFAMTSTDSMYGALLVPDVVANVADNDTSAFVITPSGPLSVNEAGTTSATYTVALATKPNSSVTLTVTPDAQVAAGPNLTFTTANWAAPQTVTVTAVDDPLVETATHAGVVAHSATSADTAYAALTPAPMNVDVTDNDTPGVVVNQTPAVDVTEGSTAGTRTYTVRLAAQPTGAVTVTPTGDAQVAVLPTSATFTNANWNTPQTFTVSAVDDSIDEVDPHSGTVTHAVTSADPLWASVTTATSVAVQVHDNDIAGVVVTQTGPYALSEFTPAATATYSVKLATEPTAPVTVTLTVPGDLGSDKTSLVFTTANWATDQIVTINAVDDAVTEATPHARTITHAAASSDGNYGAALPIDSVVANVTDNDIPGIDVSKTSLTATEGGSGDSYTVVLETQPTADVTITLAGLPQIAVPAPLVFTAANWSTPQTVNVTAVNDAVDEHPDTHAGLITGVVTSPDATYDNWPTYADIPVAITDNDVAGVTVAPGSTAINVNEAGATSAPYTVVLTSEPVSPVTVTLGVPAGQVTVDQPTLTFTPGNWSSPQTINVTAVDDAVDETDPHPVTITHTTSSSDGKYAGLTVAGQRVDIADNDTSHVTVTPVSGLSVDEATPTIGATFTVKLDTQPAGDVTVTVAPDAQVATDKSTLTFTNVNWNTAQTVTVTAVDDAVDEAPTHAGAVAMTAASAADAAYAALNPDDVAVDVADDDTAGVTIAETSVSTNVVEGGATDTYTAVLTSKPTSDVTVTSSGGLQATATPVSLTFTSANWNVAQSFTITAAQDFVVEGAHTQLFTNSATSADPNYTGLTLGSVTANISDDDVANVVIAPTTPLSLTEGITAAENYTVVLTAQPSLDVTVTVTPDAQVTPSAMTLTFTSANWNVPQTVGVIAADDFVVEGTHAGTITHSVASMDATFDNLPASNVSSTITDNDVPGVDVTPIASTATEGGGDASFSVKLHSKPTQPVDVTFAEPGQLDAITTLTFTPATWNTPQTATAHAHDDFVAENPASTNVSFDTVSTDPYYAAGSLTTPALPINVIDNDIAGVLITPTSGLTAAEGASAQYDVSLTSEPTAPVTVALAGDADGAPSPSSLTFDSTNWATPVTVYVNVTQDAIDEADPQTTAVHHVLTSTDPIYAGLAPIADQVVTITDDDTAAVIVTPAQPGPLSITEGGATATYTIKLGSEPTGDVDIDLSTIGGQAAMSPATVSFTAGNWGTPQTVTVTAVNDDVDEATPHNDQVTMVANSSDTIYAALAVAPMDLSIDDNDAAGVHFVPTPASVTEGGPGGSVSAVLESQPVAPVTVTLSSADGQLTFTPATLTFTAGNWNTPQPVSVGAFDDAVDEPSPQASLLTGTPSSSDPNFAALGPVTASVDVVDNDVAAVVVTQPVANALAESTPAAPGVDYHVKLATEPTADVTITIAPNAQVTATPATLTFTPANWATDQAVTVSAVDDAAVEPSPHTGTVTGSAASADANYGPSLAIDSVPFDITDNDTPGITVTPAAAGAVTEGGATDTYTIVLESQPSSPVTIAPVGSQLTWSVPSVTFTAADWDTPQTIVLQAIDDQVREVSPSPATLSHLVTSSDSNYNLFGGAADVTVQVTDNDTSTLIVTPTTGLTVDEAHSLPDATYKLTLSSDPQNDVVVTPTPNAQLTVSPATVTLNSSNWNTGLDVTVHAVDDAVDEGVHTGTITHTVASANSFFNGITAPSDVVDIVDNDTSGVTVSETGASTDVAESGATDTYDVKLTSQPTADVTITLAAADGQTAPSPATLTFTAATWNSAKTVTVSAVDDDVQEAAIHDGVISHTVSSADAKYDGFTIADVTAHVTDDDVAGVTFAPLSPSVTEGGTATTVTVTLTSKPTAPVTIALTPDSQVNVTPASITILPADWQTGATFDVTAVDDADIEATQSGLVSFALTSTDPFYTLVPPLADMTVAISDNDAAGVTVAESLATTAVAEAGTTTDSFDVTLTAAPAAGKDVTITLTNDADVTLSVSTLTFTHTDWNIAHAVIVTAVDDQIDEPDPEPSQISFAISSTDSDFAALTHSNVQVAVTDNDVSGVDLDPPTGYAVTEGGAPQTVSIKLTSKPSGDVTVTLNGDTQVHTPDFPAPTVLTFTPTNWNLTQDVVLSAVDDQVDEADPHAGVVTGDIASPTDALYDALADSTLDVDVHDDDTAGVSVTPQSAPAAVEEDPASPNQTTKYDVKLDSIPTGNVYVTFTTDAQITRPPSTPLMFNAGNWNIAQEVTVAVVNDVIDEAATHTGALDWTVASTDSFYGAVAAGHASVDVADDDVAGIEFAAGVGAPFALDEARTLSADLTVILTTEPTADVTVTFASSDGQVDVPAPVILTPADWSSAHDVTTKAVDDAMAEADPHAGALTYTLTSADPNYGSTTPATGNAQPLTFSIAENDFPGWTVDADPTALALNETGATQGTYEVSMNVMPAGPVTVNLAADAGGDFTVSPATYTFTPANWTTPLTVTATAVDDHTVEGGPTGTPEPHTISMSVDPSSDAGYLGTTIPDADLTVADNDVAELTITPTTPLTVKEATPATLADRATFDVKLTAQPSADVTVTFANPESQLTVPTAVTFTAADWNTPQTVTVEAHDDSVAEAAPQTATITAAITSPESDFDG
ncbi:MAG: hypothetical protein JWN41_1730, partial [Thermoleophilia bacterium]|nr:hypothetical protein [Thermoleophilia bacterium]